ncbi:MAG: hypothetical protein ACK421_06945 [Pseudanabaenaceae cyanobacterium]
MAFALFLWVLVVILSLAFAVSYLLWSPRYKSPFVIAVEVMEISTRLSLLVGGFTVFLVAIWLSLTVLQLFQAL